MSALTGCSNQDAEREAVLRVLAVRGQALNDRNLSLYLSVVSRQYRHNGKDFDAVASAAAEMFKGPRRSRYQAGETTVRIRGNRAQVRGAYRIKLEKQGGETVLDGEERLVLIREPGGWKIREGL